MTIFTILIKLLIIIFVLVVLLLRLPLLLLRWCLKPQAVTQQRHDPAGSGTAAVDAIINKKTFLSALL